MAPPKSAKVATPSFSARDASSSSASHSRAGPSSASTSTSRSRSRGVTPKKLGGGGAVETQGQTQGPQEDGLPPGVPRLDLNLEEHLEILTRLDTGDWSHELGWAQFLDPIYKRREAAAAANARKCTKNLQNAFAAADTTTTSGTNRAGTSASTQNLAQGFPEAPNFAEDMKMFAARLNDESDPAPAPRKVYLSPSKLPEHVKKCDEVIKAMDRYKEMMERTADAVVDARFHELFPQSNGEIIKKMGESMDLLEGFMNDHGSEITKLFFQQSQTNKNSTLPCPVEDQDEFISNVYEMSKLLKKIHDFNQDPEVDLELGNRVGSFVNLVDKLEAVLKSSEKEIGERDHYAKVLKGLKTPKKGEAERDDDDWETDSTE